VLDDWKRTKVVTKAGHACSVCLCPGQRIIPFPTSTTQTIQPMFTPTLTVFGAQVTPPPYPSLSSPAIAQTTLIHAVRRDNSPNILTDDQTCGYTSGAWSSAVTCGPQASCTYYTGPAAPNFGCCTNGAGCDYIATCLDYGAKGNINTGGEVGLGNQKFMW
jgi:hypothetical protein